LSEQIANELRGKYVNIASSLVWEVQNTHHDSDGGLVLGITEAQIGLHPTKPGTGNVGTVQDVEDEQKKKGGDQV
jgi:hypothetical protein